MSTSEHKTIERGRRVYCGLYGGKYGTIYRVEGTPNPGSVRSLAGNGAIVTGGRAYCDVVWDEGGRSKGIPEAIIRGVQWDIFDDVADGDQIAAALRKAEYEEMMQLRAEEAEAARQAEARRRLPAKYPHLKPYDPKSKRSDTAQCAANIRRDLKRAFPGIKFSVRSSTFSGGDSVNISWSMGPRGKDVEAVINKYQRGSFDGMTDSYSTPDDCTFTEVFAGAKYVQSQRSYPDGLVERIARDMCEKQGMEYRDLWQRDLFGPGGYTDLRDHAYRLLAETSFSPGETYGGIEDKPEEDNDGRMPWRVVKARQD